MARLHLSVSAGILALEMPSPLFLHWTTIRWGASNPIGVLISQSLCCYCSENFAESDKLGSAGWFHAIAVTFYVYAAVFGPRILYNRSYPRLISIIVIISRIQAII